jgi:hypothetical protein
MYEKSATASPASTRFEVDEFQLSGVFAAVHDRLQRRGVLDHAVTGQEKESMGRAFSFPFAPDGNSREVNRLWHRW